MTTEPLTAAGRALVIRRAMQSGVDLMDKAAMAVLAEDVIAIEQEAGDAERAATEALREAARNTVMAWLNDIDMPVYDAILSLRAALGDDR